MILEKLKKYLYRIKQASIAELVYRVQLAGKELLYRRKMRKGDFQLEVSACDSSNLDKVMLPQFVVQEDAELIESIFDGWVEGFSAGKTDIQQFEQKYSHYFYTDVPVVCKEIGLDIRAAWESARLQHLTRVLFASEELKHYEDSHSFVRNELLRWIDANQLPFGAHYQSAMECGLRIPLFLYALKLVPMQGTEQQVLLRAIYEHGWWISNRLSLYSSAGNHTVCEAVGLIFASTLFEKDDNCANWFYKGIALLSQELDHQVLTDGGPAEQSLSYHRFVLDLYWLVVDFLEKNQLADCSSWLPRLRLGEKFLFAFDDGSGGFPAIGDCDDGCAVAPGIRPKRYVVVEKNESKEVLGVLVSTFGESGYSIINRKGPLSVILDHGPLGMAPLYNHGHADALSLLLTYKGQPILIDPGTYRYNGVPEWRKYFKSTRAHNTVTIDGMDQAVQETGFIWSKPYTSTLNVCEQVNGGVFLQASHDGYARLKKPVVHTRSVLFLETEIVVLRDSFTGLGKHDFEMNLHFHPEIVLTEEDYGWRANGCSQELFIATATESVLLKGSIDPLLGWYSEAYGKKEPCSVLSCRDKGKPAIVQFFTVISRSAIPDILPLQERMHQIEQTINS